MLKLICGLSAALILIGVGGCEKRGPDARAPIKLGAIVPLTGEAALYGNNTRKGIELAVHEANQAGGVSGREVAVVFEDSKAQAKEGVSAAQKLISQDRVPVIFDDAVSSVALAVLPIADKAGVVVISSGSTNPDLSGKSRFFFRTWNSDSEEGRFSAQFAVDRLQLRKGCLLHVDNDYGRGLADVFARNFKASGGEIAASESFPQNAMEFRNQLTKLKSAGCEFVYLISYPEKIPLILNQAKELQLSQRFLGTVT
ncbi:MAG: ABC transporter substrate-binding protein, partial [Deltaproteobacteria bacterium]|nr:ABC transporter substrate-binding protein [Deltaproteobacteria bacterium]